VRSLLRRIISVLLLLPIFAMRAEAQAVHVTDGDTIKLNGTTYRLWGIDAPETKQWCGDYPAGCAGGGNAQPPDGRQDDHL